MKKPRIQYGFAAPNKMFGEELRALVRFARFTGDLKCPVCQRKLKGPWTLLTAFRATPRLEDLQTHFTIEVLPEIHPAGTLVCGEHCLREVIGPKSSTASQWIPNITRPRRN